MDEFDLELVQISVWHGSDEDFERVDFLARKLRDQKRRFVIHPSRLYLSETRPEVWEYYLRHLKKYAFISDLGLIVHDETLAWGGRLHGAWAEAYRSALTELEAICPVSIENASYSPDALWFWESFANSITFDIGHFEAAGIDCLELINSLSSDLIKKIQFIHLHRNNGPKEVGITDHWPLEEGCQEIAVLKALLKLRPEVGVILEVDGEDDLKNSLSFL
ncbi:MAG: hypothetical protein QY316_12915 [Thermodesulfobacteriota bacterium]|nr:MAG: hypothetical protein QY316_12915 [Thermodesulfobacteriota bacterium]